MEKMVWRWIGFEPDHTGERLFVFGRDMYPRFYRTKKEVMELTEGVVWAFRVRIPERFAEGNDER